MFVGRERELLTLEAAYVAESSAFVPIYGRRRVGKSELILRFLRGKPGLYYLGKVAPASLQIKELLEEAARVLDEPLLAQLSTSDWGQALRSVCERWRGPGKLVLAFDEFQWMAGASPELPSVLQALWDRSLRRSGNVMLILCGSYLGFMEREVLGSQSPLFGRRTAQILLKPFGYREAASFHRSWSQAHRAQAYFVCGGVPLYLRMFDSARSVEQNIEQNLLDEHAPLFREPDFLLREELRDVQSYYAVLLAIASGKRTVRDIAATADLPERSLPYYLQQLVDLGYVARRHPLTSRKPNLRAVHFVLEDALLRFWFRFVFPNMSFIQHMGSRHAYRDRIKPQLDAYFGSCFERMCREALPRLYEREGVSAAFQVGEYWDKHTQIDVVGLRDDGFVDLGECKWGSVSSASALTAELETKLAHYPSTTGTTVCRRYFTRESIARAPARPDARWHDLADLYR